MDYGQFERMMKEGIKSCEEQLLPKPNNNAGAVASLSVNSTYWNIWVHNKSPEAAGPFQFIRFQQIHSEIRSPAHLNSALDCMKDEHFLQNLDYIFCRGGITEEQLEPANFFGHWVDYFFSHPEIPYPSIQTWKNECGNLMGESLQSPHVYGLKILTFPGNGRNICYWTDPSRKFSF